MEGAACLSAQLGPNGPLGLPLWGQAGSRPGTKQEVRVSPKGPPSVWRPPSPSKCPASSKGSLSRTCWGLHGEGLCVSDLCQLRLLGSPSQRVGVGTSQESPETHTTEPPAQMEVGTGTPVRAWAGGQVSRRGGRGGKWEPSLGTISLWLSLETPPCSQCSLLVIFFWKTNRRAR